MHYFGRIYIKIQKVFLQHEHGGPDQVQAGASDSDGVLPGGDADPVLAVPLGPHRVSVDAALADTVSAPANHVSVPLL